MSKLDGFAKRLNALMDERRFQPYEWGVNDCALFAADAVLAVSGTDPLGDLRGSWSTEEEAADVMEAEGGLIAAMDARFPRIDVNFAKRGDIVLIKDADFGPSLAVCNGAMSFKPGADALLGTPTTKARLAWEV